MLAVYNTDLSHDTKIKCGSIIMISDNVTYRVKFSCKIHYKNIYICAQHLNGLATCIMNSYFVKFVAN